MTRDMLVAALRDLAADGRAPGRGYAEKSLSNQRGLLHGVLQRCVEQGYLPRHPGLRLNSPRSRRPSTSVPRATRPKWSARSIGVAGVDSAVLQGWTCPIDGNPDADAFVVDFTADITAKHTAVSNITIAFATNDKPFNSFGTPTPGWPGYVCKERGGGALEIYWLRGDGTEVQLATTAGSCRHLR